MNKRRIAVHVIGLVALLTLAGGLAAASPHRAAEISGSSVWASPLEIDFGTAGLGTISPPQAVTFTNNGTSFLSSFTGGLVGAPFLSTNTCDVGLFPGSTCEYSFTFAPETPGTVETTTTVETEAGPVAITLRGVGAGARLRVNPFRFDFGPVAQNSAGMQQTATLHNDGLVQLEFASISDPGSPFKVTPDCVGGVAPGASCPLYLDFTTSASSEGPYTSSVDITTTSGLTGTVALMGSAYAGATPSGQQVTPRGLDFGPVLAGTAAPVQKVTVYNRSQTDHLVDWDSGDLAAPFGVTTNCQDDIDPATFCEYTYTFDPTTPGVFAATHSITNNLGTVVIDLRGEGVIPNLTVSPRRLEFGPVTPGETSPEQAVYVTNNGLTAVPALFGGAPQPSVFGGSTTCGGGLNPGATCQFFYTFQPSALGRYEGVSVFSTDSGGENKYTIRLTGGIAFPALSLTFAPEKIAPGEIATLRIEIANPNPTTTLSGVTMNAALPAGLLVADPPMTGLGNDCGGASFQPAAGGSLLPFANGAIAGDKTCILEVDLVAAEEGNYTVSTSATSDSGPSETAAATLTVSKDEPPPPPPQYLVYLAYIQR